MIRTSLAVAFLFSAVSSMAANALPATAPAQQPVPIAGTSPTSQQAVAAKTRYDQTIAAARQSYLRDLDMALKAAVQAKDEDEAGWIRSVSAQLSAGNITTAEFKTIAAKTAKGRFEQSITLAKQQYLRELDGALRMATASRNVNEANALAAARKELLEGPAPASAPAQAAAAPAAAQQPVTAKAPAAPAAAPEAAKAEPPKTGPVPYEVSDIRSCSQNAYINNTWTRNAECIEVVLKVTSDIGKSQPIIKAYFFNKEMKQIYECGDVSKITYRGGGSYQRPESYKPGRRNSVYFALPESVAHGKDRWRHLVVVFGGDGGFTAGVHPKTDNINMFTFKEKNQVAGVHASAGAR